jgi:hypothetical protein
MRPQMELIVLPASEPSAPQSVLQVITGSDYLRRQERAKHRWATRLTIPVVVLWLTSLLLSFGTLAVAIIGLGHHVAVASFPLWLNGVALGMILLDYALLPLLEHLVQERDHYRQGRQGEEAAVEALRHHLDGRWTLFRNIVLPGKQADMDAVLVGPSGVYALEIKSYRGRFRNRGDHWWWRRYRPSWHRLTANPSRQAKANAVRLSEYLQEVVGEKVWVEPRVVWVGPGKLYIQGRPAVYIWFLDNMATYTSELSRLPAKPNDQIRRIREALTKAVESEKRERDIQV